MVIFYCSRWATAYSRKMRKISNLLSLYLYEFSSCMNKTAQIADQFLNEVWWDLNLSQLVVSDIFFRFSTSISNLTSFSFFFFFNSIFNAGWDFTWYFSFQVCLFVCLDAGPTLKLATNFRFRPNIYLVVSEINWVQDLLSSHGSYMFDTMRIQTSKIQRVSFFPFKKTRQEFDRDFCVQH